jgi:hypothetical protein
VIWALISQCNSIIIAALDVAMDLGGKCTI